jgi:hypothetical protein
MSDLAKLRELGFAGCGDLCRATLLLPVVALALRWRGLLYVRALIARTRPRATRHPVAAAQLARLVSIGARRGPFGSTCLVRSLALQWSLARHGIASELRVGVRKVDGRLDAHAWVERDGVALMEAGDVRERYAPFDSLNAARR